MRYDDDAVLAVPNELPQTVRERLAEALRCDPRRRCTLDLLASTLENAYEVETSQAGGTAATEEIWRLRRELAQAKDKYVRDALCRPQQQQQQQQQPAQPALCILTT